MIRKTFIIVIMFAQAIICSGKELSELMRPSAIVLLKEKVYIVDGTQVHYYSLSDLSYLGKFGRKGEGPGEFITTMNYPARITGGDNCIIVESINKLSYFSYDGKFIKDVKKPPLLTNIKVAGKNMVGRSIVHSTTAISRSTVSLYDGNLKKIKDLYSQDFAEQNLKGKRWINLGQDFLVFTVGNDKIFVERSPEGLLIDVFDFNGKKLYTVGDGSKGLAAGEKMRSVLEDILKNDPQIQKRMMIMKRTWKEMKRGMNFKVPEFLPAIQNFFITQGKIYIQKSLIKDGKADFVIMDIKGKKISDKTMKVYGKEAFMAKNDGNQKKCICGW